MSRVSRFALMLSVPAAWIGIGAMFAGYPFAGRIALTVVFAIATVVTADALLGRRR